MKLLVDMEKRTATMACDRPILGDNTYDNCSCYGLPPLCCKYGDSLGPFQLWTRPTIEGIPQGVRYSFETNVLAVGEGNNEWVTFVRCGRKDGIIG